MTATWTDLDRPTMKDALDWAYLDGLRQNALWLKERMDVGHNGGAHTAPINGTTLRRAYPAAAFIATTVAGPAYSKGTSTNVTSVTRTGLGVARVVFATAFASVNDYAAIAQVIDSPDTGAPLASWCVHVTHVSTTAVDLTFNMLSADGTVWGVNDPPGFCMYAWGRYTSAATPWSTWEYIPRLLDGPVPTEWWTGLLTNVALLRARFDGEHSLNDGGHRANLVPNQEGVATYKTSIDAADDRLWVVEPWSCGTPEGSAEKLDSTFDLAGTATTARLLSLKLGSGHASQYTYGTLATMNPYQTAATRGRLVHPYQYRDAIIFAPRYFDGSAWSWAEQDINRTGAPDSIAFMRFVPTYIITAPDAAARLSGITAASAADERLSGVLYLTLVAEELAEFKRLFENGHSSTDGTHDVSPPGIMGVACVTWDGANYNIQSWSRGFSGSTGTVIATSPVGCRLTFSSTFNSYRNWGAIAIGHQTAGAGYQCIQVVRSSATTLDVHQFSGAGSTALHEDFDIVVFGVR